MFRFVPKMFLIGLLAVGVVYPMVVDAAIINFKSSVTVTSQVVRLGDVATIYENDDEAAKRLNNVTLIPAPAAGSRTKLPFATIRDRLRNHGIDLATAEFTGSSEVWIFKPLPETKTIQVSMETASPLPPKPAAKFLSPNDIKRAQRLVAEAVRRYLQRRAPEMGDFVVSVNIDSADVPKVLEAAISGYEVRGGAAPWNQPQQLEVRFVDRNEELHSISVNSITTRHPRVLTVKYDLPRGHVIRTADLAWMQTENPTGTIDQEVELVGKETVKNLRAQRPIRTDDVRNIPLVRSNDIVTVSSRRAGITVRREFKAKGTGAKGDTIQLVSLDGRERLLARVTAFHEAEVVDSTTASQPTSGRTEVNAERLEPAGHVILKQINQN